MQVLFLPPPFLFAAQAFKRLLNKKIKRRAISLCVSKQFGGDKRDRTADLLNAIQALSQLSYAPITIKIILERRVLVNTCAAAYKNFVGR